MTKEKESEIDCTKALCTYNYVALSVEIVSPEGNPVILDSYTVTDLKNGKDISHKGLSTHGNDFLGNGSYTLFSDAWLPDYQNSATTLPFSGVKNGKELASREFGVAADCCHVSLTHGDTTLIVE